MSPDKVTVIIPTVAEKSREHQIKRCIDSVRKSSIKPLNIIIVVNGNRYDQGIYDWLKAQKDLRTEYLEKGSLPLAILHGRSLVDTPFFSTLDDDDEYLEASTDNKLAALKAEPNADLVVTNGFRHIDGTDTSLYSQTNQVSTNPLASLFDENWLNSGNALYRTSSIPKHFFEQYHSYAEWTWLAYQLAMAGKKIVRLESYEFRIHDSADSLSKSQAFDNAYFELFKRMLATSPPKPIKKIIAKKLGAAYHTAASQNLADGDRLQALKNHCSSLLYPGALRYLLFGRKLIPGWPV